VLDVCWSTDGKRIVSCSIDHTLVALEVETGKNFLIIGPFNSTNFAIVLGNKLALIKEHESRHPMGLSWDPMAEYFISLSNSR
jgi:hypothetical protein